MQDFICKKCKKKSRAVTLANAKNPSIVGLYCEHCGTWQKWLNKAEKRELTENPNKVDDGLVTVLTDVILQAEARQAYFDEFTLDDLVWIILDIADRNKIKIPYLEEYRKKCALRTKQGR